METTMTIIENAFDSKRSIIVFNAGDKSDKWDRIAVPITEKEEHDIRVSAKNHKMYNNLPMASLVSIGDPHSPGKDILERISYIKTKEPNSETMVKSYYYPPKQRPTTFKKDGCIVFEDARAAWGWNTRVLLKNPKFKAVLILKFKKETK